MTPEPSAPPLYELVKNEDVRYGCENGCDVEFLVGKTADDLMRIPVHSCKLNKNPVFKAMFSENFQNNNCQWIVDDNGTKKRQIQIVGIDGKGFDNLMKCIYQKPVNLQSPETAVETLKAAHELLFPDVVRTCVRQLSDMISSTNVIYIFAHVRFLCNDMEDLEELTKKGSMSLPKRHKSTGSTSAPHQLNHSPAGLEMKMLCVWLLCQCLEFIDVHAEKVIESDELEELEGSCLRFLLKRDSLDVSESAVFFALVRWAETECKRQHLPLTAGSKRCVLRDLIYLARFFQMTSSEFFSGPENSGLLTSEEMEVTKNMINHGRPYLNNKCFVHTSSPGPKQPGHRDFQSLDSNGALIGLKAHWSYMSRRRNPRVDGENCNCSEKMKKHPCGNGNNRRRKPRRFRRISIVIKNFCLPCSYTSSKDNADVSNSHFEKNQIYSSQQGGNEKNDISKGNTSQPRLQRRESTLSKMFDYSLRAFAFFFD